MHRSWVGRQRSELGWLEPARQAERREEGARWAWRASVCAGVPVSPLLGSECRVSLHLAYQEEAVTELRMAGRLEVTQGCRGDL